jgi:hypothetical protein
LQAATAAAFMLLNSEGDIDTAHRLLTGAIETQTGQPDIDMRALTEALPCGDRAARTLRPAAPLSMRRNFRRPGASYRRCARAARRRHHGTGARARSCPNRACRDGGGVR